MLSRELPDCYVFQNTASVHLLSHFSLCFCPPCVDAECKTHQPVSGAAVPETVEWHYSIVDPDTITYENDAKPFAIS